MAGGRTWTILKVSWQEAEEEDSRFWYDQLTPEERVEAVASALESCLKARSLDVVPRLRRVHRRIQCPRAKPHTDQRPANKFAGKRGFGRAAMFRRGAEALRGTAPLRLARNR